MLTPFLFDKAMSSSPSPLMSAVMNWVPIPGIAARHDLVRDELRAVRFDRSISYQVHHHRIVRPRVAAVVGVVPLAGHQILLAVAVDVDEQQGVRSARTAH